MDNSQITGKDVLIGLGAIVAAAIVVVMLHCIHPLCVPFMCVISLGINILNGFD